MDFLVGTYRIFYLRLFSIRSNRDAKSLSIPDALYHRDSSNGYRR